MTDSPTWAMDGAVTSAFGGRSLGGNPGTYNGDTSGAGALAYFNDPSHWGTPLQSDPTTTPVKQSKNLDTSNDFARNHFDLAAPAKALGNFLGLTVGNLLSVILGLALIFMSINALLNGALANGISEGVKDALRGD